MKKVFLVGLLAGLVMLIVSMLFGTLFIFVAPSLMAEYNNPQLFLPWQDPRMLLYFVYFFLVGVLLAFAWDKTKKLYKGKIMHKGIEFGLSYWALATIPGMIITYGSMPVSFLMVFSWTLGALIHFSCAGWLYAKLLP